MREKEILKIKNNSKKKYQSGETLIVAILSLCAILGGVLLSSLGENDTEIKFIQTSGDGEDLQIVLEEEIELPTFKSKEEILEKVAKSRNPSVDGIYFEAMESINSEFDMVTSNSALKDSPTTGASDNSEKYSDYSTTNVQVENVDEADIVKTNGDYIYYLSKGNLYIFETKTTETKLIKTIKLNKNFYYNSELYIDDNYITVITQEDISREELENSQETEKEKNKEDAPVSNSIALVDRIYPVYHTTGTAMYVYDINSHELVKKVSVEGNYISSRKIEDNIYLVTNKYIYPYSVNEDNVLPLFNCKEIPATDIKYFPDMKEKTECSYMMITSLDLSNIDEEANIDTYLGAGNEIYCSKDNLYVTRVEYNYSTNYSGFIEVINNENAVEDRVVTRIHKFKLLDGDVSYVATGKVTGSLLNQYSMDESNGYFRITTTSDSGNNLYVLNEKLEEVGALKNLAEGEKIYATRFMGDKCYLVTYKTVDPLFVIDLSEPTNPTVLGELKIPGYSTYLHPLGDNYLIGFGEDSVEKSYLNWKGEQQVTAYNVGMKLAIFDISDLNNPKEIHSVKIGGRGSYSELLDNPKVLYYEDGMFAFPAVLTEETKFYEDGTPMYGDEIFRGALIYDLDVEDGIKLRGEIEHEQEERKYDSNIERIIRIRDDFYTLSSTELKVTDIETMKEVEEGRCKIEVE